MTDAAAMGDGPDNEGSRLTYDPSVIGSTGLRQSGGFVHEEFLPELVGLKGARVYREMSDNDPIVGALVFAITTLIRQAEWSVQAVDETPEAEAAKEFVEQVMHDMSVPWSTVVNEACSMFVYGFAPMEIVWKRRRGPDEADGQFRSAYTDGKIGVRTISLRAQPTIVRWDIDPTDGSILGLWQQPYTGGQVYIPIEKLLLFRTTDERSNPEGRSALRTAYRSWHYKKRIENIEAIGVERDLAGLPIAYVPGHYFSPSADVKEKQILAAWQTLVTSIRRDQKEGLVVPSDRDSNGNLLFEMKLLNSGGSRTFDTTKIVQRYDQAIATSLLADFIFLGQQAVGSFALSSDKTALFAASIGAFVKAIADVFSRHLFTRLFRLNGMPADKIPTLTGGDLEHANLQELGDFISKLVTAGAPMFPDIELENSLRRMAGLPPAPEERDIGDEAQMAADAAAARAGVRQGDPAVGPDGMPIDPAANDNPDEDEPPAKVGKGRVLKRQRLEYDAAGLITHIIEEAVS